MKNNFVIANLALLVASTLILGVSSTSHADETNQMNTDQFLSQLGSVSENNWAPIADTNELIEAQEQPNGDLTVATSNFDISLSDEEISISLDAETDFSITPDSADLSILSVTEDGAIVTDTNSGDKYSLLPTESGLQLVGAIENKNSSEDHIFTLSNSDTDLRAEFFDDGSFFLFSSSGDQLGLFEVPWAVDANGKPVPTEYEVRDGKLIQHVFHRNADFEYPIIFDPQWSYSFTIDQDPRKPMNASILTAMKELKRCFNCSFPVEGAPKAFPKVGSRINLTVPVYGAAPVKVTKVHPSGFSFEALPGHFDGAGSTITFTFNQKCSLSQPRLILKVNATVKKDRGLENNAIKAGAYTSWMIFVNRLASNAHKNFIPNKCG